MTAMQKHDAFARRLRRILEKHGLTSADLARRMFDSYGYTPYNVVSYWLNAKAKPGYDSLVSIKEAIGCTWEELMES